MKKNDIFAVLLVCVIVFAFVACLCKYGTIESQSYANANDGGYVPVYKVQAPAMRIGNVVEVEWRGETYSAYLTPESEIETGDNVICTFTICEGRVELINIE